MRAIACELCGGNDLVKQGEYFVCQTCGAMYDLEAAKRLIESSAPATDAAEASWWHDQELQKPMPVVTVMSDEQYLDPRNTALPITEEQYQELLSMITDTSNKVAVIKRLMELTGWGLREAKDYTEEVLCPAAGIGVRSQEGQPSATPITEEQYQELIDILSDTGDKITAIKRLRELTGWSLKEAKDYTEDVLCPAAGVQPTARKGGCYIATAVYGSYDCPEVWTLRRFRDERLALSRFGRLFVRTYYAVSPTLVRLFGGSRWFRGIGRAGLDRFVGRLRGQGVSSLPYEDKDL